MKKSIFVFFTIFLVLFSIGAVAAMDDNLADENSIENTGIDDKSFEDLQKIVNDSSSGDTIYLNGTTFKANSNDSSISITKDLTINGASLYNKFLKSTIDGSQLLKIMSVTAKHKLTLININFVNGHTTDNGAVISAGSSSTIKIENCVFSNNYAEINGGVIYVERKSTVEIKDSNFLNNAVLGSGGVIYVERDSSVGIQGSNFLNNGALGNGGVISTDNGVQLTINQSTFTNNTVKNNVEGGGIIFGSIQSSINIYNSIFKDSSAYYYGGAIYAKSNSVINSYHNLFVNCTSLSNGGAISTINSEINIVESVFRQNNAKFDGGAIHGTSSICSISKSAFEDNLVGRCGGAIYSGLTCTISDSNFTNNTSNSTLIGEGGAIYGVADVNVNNCKFFDNKVLNGNGGVVYGISNINVINSLFVNSYSTNGAGAIYGMSYLVSIVNSTFINSTSMDDGGVIYCDSNVYISNCTFINSTSMSDGGVIYGNLDMTVVNSSFINSHANNSAGSIYGWSKVTVSNSTFVNSICNLSGGAIYGDIFINVFNSKFVNNSAAYSGGAINGGENADILISNSGFYSNNATDGATLCGGNNTNVVNSTFIQNYGIDNVVSIINGEVMASKFINNTCTNGVIIYCRDSIKINKSYFDANHAYQASTVTGTNITVESSEFKNNDGYCGGAIQGQADSNIIVNKSVFTNNNAAFGGAIFNINRLEVYDSIFINNTAESIGSAILSDHGIEVISNSKFSNINETNGTAVIYLESSSKTSLAGNEISTNILPIFANGEIISPTTLEFLNASGDINKTIELSAYLKDDNGNIIGSYSLIEATIDNQTVIYNYDNETHSFKTTHSMNKYGLFTITGVYWNCDNLNVEVGTLTIYIKTSIIANDFVKYHNNGTNLICQLVDVNMIGIANRTIVIFINGINYTKNTNDTGFARMNINLGAGTYRIHISFNGDALYGPSNKTITLKVLSTIVSADLVKYFHNESQFVVTILEGNGKPSPHAYVIFNINGIFYYKLTDEYGMAKLNINLGPGTYIITTICDESIASNNVTVLSTIFSDDLVKYYRNESQFVVRVVNNQGFVAVGVNVTFNINGIFYHKITDLNGTAMLKINLPPNNYIITTTVGDLSVSNTIKVLSTILSEDIEMDNLNRIPFQVTVLDDQGNPAEDMNLTFNINGVIYNRTSNIDGTAKININLMPGKYIVTTTYKELMQSNIITIL